MIQRNLHDFSHAKTIVFWFKKWGCFDTENREFFIRTCMTINKAYLFKKSDFKPAEGALNKGLAQFWPHHLAPRATPKPVVGVPSVWCLPLLNQMKSGSVRSCMIPGGSWMRQRRSPVNVRSTEHQWPIVWSIKQSWHRASSINASSMKVKSKWSLLSIFPPPHPQPPI